MNTYNLVQITALATVLASYSGDTITIGEDGIVMLTSQGRPIFIARLPEGYALIAQPIIQ